MPSIPSCLNSRYKALDQLMGDLTESSMGDPGIQLMCSIWKALQDEPPSPANNCKCKQQELQPFTPKNYGNPYFVYMARETPSNMASPTAPGDGACCMPPLSKALNSLQKAATFDQSCSAKLKQLIEVESKLQEQISKLEQKEQVGINLLKEADAMWKDMEETYKMKIATCLSRQVDLVSQLQEIEKSAAKWRKNKKELESQLETIGKCQREILGKINQKKNDLKLVEGDISSVQNKIKKTQGEIDGAKSELINKLKLSDARVLKVTEDLTKLQEEVDQESKRKVEKEKEGKAFIKAAREDLQQMCKILMQKQLEVEDRCAEKNGIIEECNMLKDTADLCQERCKTKEANISQEINKVDKEIAEMRLKCGKCNVSIDSEDIRKFCVDCPRCQAIRLCLIQGEESCSADPNEDCVCLYVKQKFLDNVFENMYTVLAKKMTTPGGKQIAEDILQCLKNSRNGKLDKNTRKLLKEFILCFVKKNLNLTIVGGAIKTRCELDDKTYNQLMLCLKTVVVSKIPKVETGTDPKKPSCVRWPESTECNCPKGPKDCICTKKAPPPIDDPAFFPPEPPEEENVTVMCPSRKKEVCGPDCSAYVTDKIGAAIANKRPDPCHGGTRAAQTEPPKPVPEPVPAVTSNNSCICVCGNSKKDTRQRQFPKCDYTIQEVLYENNRMNVKNKVERASSTKDITLEGKEQRKNVKVYKVNHSINQYIRNTVTNLAHGSDNDLILPYVIREMSPLRGESDQDQLLRPKKWVNVKMPSESVNKSPIFESCNLHNSHETRNRSSSFSKQQQLYRVAYNNNNTYEDLTTKLALDRSEKGFSNTPGDYNNVELQPVVKVEENKKISNILKNKTIPKQQKMALVQKLLSKNNN